MIIRFENNIWFTTEANSDILSNQISIFDLLLINRRRTISPTFEYLDRWLYHKDRIAIKN
jgi:hypothetical protein